MKKYDKIRSVKETRHIKTDNGLEVTIKYDGSNGRLSYDGAGFCFGTRTQENHDITKFEGRFNSLFAPLHNKIENLPDNLRQELAGYLTKYTIFFELCGKNNKHKLNYNWDIKYIIFDGYDNINECYISCDNQDIQHIIALLGFMRAEILPITTYTEAFNWILEQDPNKVEGIVIKNYISGERCKIVHPQNSNIKRIKMRINPIVPNAFEDLFFEKYITINRLEQIHDKLYAETGLEGMKLFGKVLGYLFQDLIVECLPEFILEHKAKIGVFDISYIKKEMPNRARPIFETIINQP